MLRSILLSAMVTGFAMPCFCEETSYPIPEIPGLELTRGESITVPGAVSEISFTLKDGRIGLTGEDGKGVWTNDGGKTWAEGPKPPDDKTAIDLGGGEILSFTRNTEKQSDGKFTLNYRRSTDNWKTVQQEVALVDIPQAANTGGDDGEHKEGMLMHHGIVQLKNGDLMATFFGSYTGDTDLADGYPAEFYMRKYRTIVAFSPDRGRTWGNPVLVAYDKMLARGLDPDSSVKTTTTVPAITQEGFCEPDLVTAPNGDIVCLMRSGGRIGAGTPIFPTPLYASTSTDEGKTWTPPVPIADRGVCPNAVTLENGIMVCSYARPGAWLIFSDDNGRTWKGATQIARGNGYHYLAEVGPDTFLSLLEINDKVVGNFFTIKKK